MGGDIVCEQGSLLVISAALKFPEDWLPAGVGRGADAGA
jgi:hypothetical protein